MKYWKCTVCGYIHEGSEPPEKCPVCGAPREKFEELPEEEGKKAKEEYDAGATKKKDNQEKGENKPDSGKVEPETTVAPSSEQGLVSMLYSQITGLMTKHKAHPISVHFPNGLLPVTVLFLFLSFVLETMGFDRASFYNLVVVALAMPMVFFSGYVDWQVNYKGRMTTVFKHKIAMGLIVTALCYALVIWRFVDPDVAAPGNDSRYVFLAIHIAMLGAAVYAGNLGGKLVFKD